MNIIDLIRLVRKHIVILILAPLLPALLLILMTRSPDYKYSSQTTLYTGIASGSSIEMDKSYNFFATNTAFDNLINIIKSRETQQEVAIRLLSIHLMLDRPDPKYISEKSLATLKHITPSYIYDHVVRGTANPQTVATSALSGTPLAGRDALPKGVAGQPGDTDARNYLPRSIDPAAYEQTVRNLTRLMEGSDTSFIYELLNFPNPHYSFKALSGITAQRIANSDLVQVRFTTDDPGICQQTLAILIEICKKNYKAIKENRSDAVVKYFEQQLERAAARLRAAEDELLKFNKENNIINYYEQSKAVAVVKEDIEVEYNKMKMKLAGVNAAIARLEEKLGIQQQIQLKSDAIIQKRNLLGEIKFRIASLEDIGAIGEKEKESLQELKSQADVLIREIRASITDLYSYGNTVDGLPVGSVLNDWISNVIEAENVRAGMEVMVRRIDDFQKQYAVYAPAGAMIKRIEREISVSEEEFLEILHSLNLARLKLQDSELASNIKIVDQPYYPISPIPTKRKILVILSALIGLLIVSGSILAAEYFDNTLKNPVKAGRILNLPFLGALSRILLRSPNINQVFIVNRLLEVAIQNMDRYFIKDGNSKPTRNLLLFSTLGREGTTIIAGNLASKLKKQGKSVVYLNYSGESLRSSEIRQTGSQQTFSPDFHPVAKRKGRLGWISRLLGYPDNRIDRESPFLAHPESLLEPGEYLEYNIDERFSQVRSCRDLLEMSGYSNGTEPDIILTEIPPILYFPYPSGLVEESDLPLLVCRSNRVWTEADQSAVDSLGQLSARKIHFILNGVDIQSTESVIGELPRKRSWLRRGLKNLFRLQFFSKNGI